MKTYYIDALYTISVHMEVEAENYNEALEIAESFEPSTEWDGNSVFVGDMPDGMESCTLEADGMMRDFECEYGDEEDE